MMASATTTPTTLAQQYQKKTDKQHILDNPDTYIGSVENVDANLWVFSSRNEERGQDGQEDAPVPTPAIVLKNMEYVPGLYKLFDEGIVNCRDHVVRMAERLKRSGGGGGDTEGVKGVTYIAVTLDPVSGTITMENDGNGIDVAKHPEYNLWIPEMIFGHLRTSTNYNQDEKRIVGGKNGFGFKLVLIWSTQGSIETVDHVRGLRYTQSFGPHLDTISDPVIVPVKGRGATKPYTKVTFTPDYVRLGVTLPLSPDVLALFQKRVYDISAITDAKLKVSYNGSPVPIKTFLQYVDLYVGKGAKKVHESAENGRWEYCVVLSPTQQFEQVSFVNGICAFKGGKHVDYVMGQLTRKVAAYIEKKKKLAVNPNTIKEQLMLFLRCDIENPAFDSQTKDYMNTPAAKFGSSCSVSDAFVEKVAKMGVMETACSLTELKDRHSAKKTDGSKTRVVRGIANFIDANWAGSVQHSRDCVLILCEGLSAMSGVVSGLSSEDRNRYGIYPLKGKLLNVRGEAVKKIAENKEIGDLKRILGLETGKVYETMDDVARWLRYGKILMLCDSDVDGSHIKALCVNLFQSEWASLFRLSGFLSFMNTPILRAKKGAQTLLFYNQGEYEAWVAGLGPSGGGTQGWTIKYFKGLGTSTGADFKGYFAHPKCVDFVYTGPAQDDAVDKVFNKKRADERKSWLEQYDKTAYLNTSTPTVPYTEFIDKELIHFSVYDCERSIPNMVDGLKISQRKILYCAFKRRLTHEIKVAQFSGYVSEHSEYRHGENSLHGAIIGMAQTFVGSNNLNVLTPNGQFGSRLQGGEDAASERYIFTQLNPLTRLVFPEADDPILHYLSDDGHPIEPDYYVPILPFVLCNGIAGIGTGFSSSLPPFDPLQIVRVLRQKLQGSDIGEGETFVPFYQNFKGTVTPVAEEPHKFMVRGVFERVASNPTVIRITELPVGTWTMPYTTFLEGLVDGGTDKQGRRVAPVLKDVVSHCTEKQVDFRVTFVKEGGLTDDEVVKTLKLSTTVSTTNMHLFDHESKLHKYPTVGAIVDAFYEVRLRAYQTRKTYMIEALERVLVKLSNRVRYILGVLDGSIELRRRSSGEIHALLSDRGFALLDGSYDYLVKMPMVSVAQDHVDKLLREKSDTETELTTLRETTPAQLWLRELDTFEQSYTTYRRQREEEYRVGDMVTAGTTTKTPKTTKKKMTPNV